MEDISKLGMVIVVGGRFDVGTAQGTFGFDKLSTKATDEEATFGSGRRRMPMRLALFDGILAASV